MYTRRVVLGVLVGLLGLTGCAGRLSPAAPRLPVEETPTPQPRAHETTPVPSPPFDPATVIAAARSVEPRTTVGALVIDRASGDELLAIEPDRPFRSASLVKLLIAIDALEREPAEPERKRLWAMLARSDDDVASALWVRGGGAAILKRTGERLGLGAIRSPRDPGRWGDVLITAHDIARIYDYVLTELPELDRELIVAALAEAPRVAKDGFDQHFGIPNGLGGTWAIKQGWSDSATDLVFHSTGLVGDGWPYVVVLLTEHPLGIKAGSGPSSVTAAAKALSSWF